MMMVIVILTMHMFIIEMFTKIVMIVVMVTMNQ